jgi:hypothetical protein
VRIRLAAYRLGRLALAIAPVAGALEDLGDRHVCGVDAALLERCPRPREMPLGYDGKTGRKILQGHQ